MQNFNSTNQMITIEGLITEHPITVKPLTIMTEVGKLFEENSFHHIPVVNDNMECVGIISKSDYYQLQDKFTKWNLNRIEQTNKRFMESLIAKEVMTDNPACLAMNASLQEALKIFLENKFHSLPITKNGEFYGILTTFDLLKYLKEIVKT